MGIASLILGILALLGCWFPYAGILPGLVAIILGVIGRKKLLAEGRSSGVAIGGIITGVLALVANTAVTVACALCASACNSAIENAENNPSSADDPFGLGAAIEEAVEQENANAPVKHCNLSATPARLCTEYRLTLGMTAELVQESCNSSQVMTAEAERVASADGTCPTENAIAKCEMTLGGQTMVTYRDTGEHALSFQEQMTGAQNMCPTGTFTRLAEQ